VNVSDGGRPSLATYTGGSQVNKDINPHAKARIIAQRMRGEQVNVTGQTVSWASVASEGFLGLRRMHRCARGFALTSGAQETGAIHGFAQRGVLYLRLFEGNTPPWETSA